MAKIKIVSTDQTEEFTIPTGSELIAGLLYFSNFPLKFGCCRGECGVCAIKVLEGKECLTKLTKEEKITLKRKDLTDEYRLACQCALNGDILIEKHPF